MSKQTKQTVDNIQLIDTPETLFFEVRLVVTMPTEEDEQWLSPAEWLQNILFLASKGDDMKEASEAYLHSIVNISERRIHLCSLERIEA